MTVIAADRWDAPMEEMRIPGGEPGSWEDVMPRAGAGDKLLLLKQAAREPDWREARGHRAIGVVYNPGHERYGNYVSTVLPERYDTFVSIDESYALHPLHIEPISAEPPDLYPWGI